MKVDFEGGVPLVEGSRAWWFAESKRFWPVGGGLEEGLERVLTVGLSLEGAGRFREELSACFDLAAVEEELPRVVPPVVRATFEGSLTHLEAELEFDYEAYEGAFLKDEEAESAARMFLREWGFEKGRGSFVLKDQGGDRALSCLWT